MRQYERKVYVPGRIYITNTFGYYIIQYNCDNSITIFPNFHTAMDWTIRVLGFNSLWGLGIFSSPLRPDWLWGPPASYQMGSRGSFPGGEAARA
jgi:hypothetical protein